MKYCKICGAPNDDLEKKCDTCAAPFDMVNVATQPSKEPEMYTSKFEDTEPAYSQPPPPRAGSMTGKNPAVLWLVLNIIGTSFTCFGNVFGIAGIIFAAISMDSFKKGDMVKGMAKLKTSKIMFVVSFILSIISLILFFSLGGINNLF